MVATPNSAPLNPILPDNGARHTRMNRQYNHPSHEMEGPVASQGNEVLEDIEIGRIAAENELSFVRNYFIETTEYKKLLQDTADTLMGPKGSGKSAIYAYLFSSHEYGVNPLPKRTHGIGVVNPQDSGRPVFDEVRLDPRATESDFRRLWKLYFLVLLADFVRTQAKDDKKIEPETLRVIEALVRDGLLKKDTGSSVRSYFAAAVSYLMRAKIQIGGKPDPITGLPPIAASVSFPYEPIPEREIVVGQFSSEDAIETLIKYLIRYGQAVWIGIDRLDASFNDDPEMESLAIRGLLRAQRDLRIYEKLKIKVFLRDDVWKRITRAKSFPEADHFESTKITWNRNSLLQLVMKRMLASQKLAYHLNIIGRKEEVLKDVRQLNELFKRIFPKQMLLGKRNMDTFDWMLETISDATKRPCPRELLHLIIAAREEQLKLLPPDGGELIGSEALENAIPAVSDLRFEESFCSEFPELGAFARMLTGKRIVHTQSSIARAFNEPEAKSALIAEKLVDAGILHKIETKRGAEYKVPHIYRHALKLNKMRSSMSS